MNARTTLLLGFAILSSSCGIFEDDIENLEQPSAYSFSSCGPTGEPALDVIIPAQKSSCSESANFIRRPPWDKKFTRIWVYDNLPLQPGRFYQFGESLSEENPLNTWIGLCRAGELNCEAALEGTLRIIETPRGPSTVEVAIVHESDTFASGRYILRQCPKDSFTCF